MPNLNGIGPEGRGPLTGKKMGRCRDKESSKKESTERDDFVDGRGEGGRPRGGRGFGFGGGRRRRVGSWGREFGRGYGYGRRIDDDSPKDSNKDDN